MFIFIIVYVAFYHNLFAGMFVMGSACLICV